MTNLEMFAMVDGLKEVVVVGIRKINIIVAVLILICWYCCCNIPSIGHCSINHNNMFQTLLLSLCSTSTGTGTSSYNLNNHLQQKQTYTRNVVYSFSTIPFMYQTCRRNLLHINNCKHLHNSYMAGTFFKRITNNNQMTKRIIHDNNNYMTRDSNDNNEDDEFSGIWTVSFDLFLSTSTSTRPELFEQSRMMDGSNSNINNRTKKNDVNCGEVEKRITTTTLQQQQQQQAQTCTINNDVLEQQLRALLLFTPNASCLTSKETDKHSRSRSDSRSSSHTVWFRLNHHDRTFCQCNEGGYREGLKLCGRYDVGNNIPSSSSSSSSSNKNQNQEQQNCSNSNNVNSTSSITTGTSKIVRFALNRQYYGPRCDILLDGVVVTAPTGTCSTTIGTFVTPTATTTTTTTTPIISGSIVIGTFLHPMNHPDFFNLPMPIMNKQQQQQQILNANHSIEGGSSNNRTDSSTITSSSKREVAVVGTFTMQRILSARSIFSGAS